MEQTKIYTAKVRLEEQKLEFKPRNRKEIRQDKYGYNKGYKQKTTFYDK